MQTSGTETNGQIAALYRLVPELGRLEGLLANANTAALQSLRKFAADPDLKRLRELIEEQRAEFDAIAFLGLSNSEEFHSNLLAWLLDPQQSHGLGGYFLRNFLLKSGAQFEVNACNWSRTSVHREWPNLVGGQWGYLDILVVDECERDLCAIENKVWSWEHSEQLTRYRKALEKRYPDYTRYHVFLSPAGFLPYLEEEQEHWTAVNYKVILQLVEQTISDSTHSIKEDVRTFLQQYVTTLRRNIVPDANTNIAELVRQIYLEHRETIELIIANRPNLTDEAKLIFKTAIASYPALKLDVEDKEWFAFRSAEWDKFEVTRTGRTWNGLGSNALLIFQVRFQNGLPWLDLGLSSGNIEGVRKQLYEAVRQHPEAFRLVHPLSGNRVALHEQKDYILDDSDLGVDWDSGVTRAKIEAWVKDFAENRFPAMNAVIVDCLREYEAEQPPAQ